MKWTETPSSDYVGRDESGVDFQPSPRGVHFIADFYDCALDRLASSERSLAALQSSMYELLSSHGFKVLGSHFHFFAPNAVTATICLAESHLNFHSWPEHRYVSIDLFACTLLAPAEGSAGEPPAAGATCHPQLRTLESVEAASCAVIAELTTFFCPHERRVRRLYR